jgi:hypothetical protein
MEITSERGSQIGRSSGLRLPHFVAETVFSLLSGTSTPNLPVILTGYLHLQTEPIVLGPKTDLCGSLSLLPYRLVIAVPSCKFPPSAEPTPRMPLHSRLRCASLIRLPEYVSEKGVWALLD